jgi:regulator of protease activity HflC (stomatin/prohibitin superfamily)
MKITIREDERGFLFKDNLFQRMILSGVFNTSRLSNEIILTTNIQGQVNVRNTDINILLKDENFRNSIATCTVADLQVAIHFKDGIIVDVLLPNTYYFWNIYDKNEFIIIDLTKPEVTELRTDLLRSIPEKYYSKILILEGQEGLLYYDGKFQRELTSGVYYFWKGSIQVTYQVYDLRLQQLEINGQEILTVDKVSLRLNFVCSYKVTNPTNISLQLKDYKEQIYILAQLVLREYVGTFKFDELLEQKEKIASFVLNKLKEKQESLYINFIDAGLKDIILPGEIKDIMNTVLVAEKKAQANIISRREEVASTRSLLNTAKLMEENKTLYKLKELEYLEKICDKVGNISIGNGNLLGQLNDILEPK